MCGAAYAAKFILLRCLVSPARLCPKASVAERPIVLPPAQHGEHLLADALREKLVARASAANAQRMCRHLREANAEHFKLMSRASAEAASFLKVSRCRTRSWVGRPMNRAHVRRWIARSHPQQAGCIDQRDKPLLRWHAKSCETPSVRNRDGPSRSQRSSATSCWRHSHW